MAVLRTRKGEEILVDDDLLAVLSQTIWHINDRGYVIWSVMRDGKKTTIRMHQTVYELKHGPIPEGLDVDHVDRNRRNNQDSNLRLTTRSQNLLNKNREYPNQTGYIGVICRTDVSNPGTRYRAYVNHNGKTVWCGQFQTPEEAARAHDRRAIELQGKFAHLNFPNT